MPQLFTAEREDHDGAIMIVLTDELDIATVPAAEEQLRAPNATHE